MRWKLPATLLLLAACAAAQDRDVTITWIGQACFAIKTDGGPLVVVDPPAPSIGYTIPPLNADVVTVSHNHGDHNNTAGVGGSFTLVDGRPVTSRREMQAASMPFILIPGFHDNQNGAQRGQNTIIRWTQSGLKIAHMGDLGQEQLTAAQLADLTDLDILFMPAGGFFTVTPERAAAYARELKAKVTILMHYRTAMAASQLAGLPAAAADFSPVLYKPATVVVNRLKMPLSPEVWVMQPLSDIAPANAATFAAGEPVAPGSIVSVFGSFTGSQTAGATYPLPKKIGETEVLVDGRTAPLYYASPTQVNFQVPAAQAVGQGLLEVRVNGQQRGRGPLTVLSSAPGIFVVANQDGRVNSTSAPAHPGESLVIYGTGQGAVLPPVEDGAAAASRPLSTSIGPPNVFLQGKQLEVQFSGLAPGFAGLWQINALLGQDAPTGSALTLVVTNGLSSNQMTVTVTR